MAGSGRKWLIGCGVGCAAAVLLLILLIVGGGFLMTRSFDRAAGHQKQLAELYGSREDFIPPADGIGPDRIERFLAVREILMDNCAGFQDIAADFRSMEDLENQADDVSKVESFRRVRRLMGSVFGIAGRIGELSAARNEALLANGMGLGEYTWIYVLAYYSWLGNTPGSGLDNEGTGFSRQELDLVCRLMLNHAAALAEAGRTEDAEYWRNEVERLERADGGVPFQHENLPREVVAAFAPYRTRFEATYCPEMAEFDLGRVEKKGLSYHSE